MRAYLTGLVAAVMMMSSAAAQERSASTLERGISTLLQDNEAEALPLLRQAIIEEPGNPEAYAWLADALRRSDSLDASLAMARRAIALAPCNAHAHTTLGDLYNPQFSSWEQASSDSTWAHLEKAVACDPKEGMAWFGLWIEAMRRGNGDIEKRALQTLASSGFITPGALAYARWMLGSLPKNAILLTNGDMDTYPLVTLQQSAGFRTDVAVINAAMLEMNWYAALMTTRYRITGGYTAAEIEELEPVYSDGEISTSVAQQVIGRWIAARRSGALKRPIASVVDAPWLDLDPKLTNMTLAGPYWIYNAGKSGKPYDLSQLWSSLRALKADEFKGEFVSSLDRSPIRITYSPAISGSAIVQYVRRMTDLLRQMGGSGMREAEKLDQWGTAFHITTTGFADQATIDVAR